MTRTRDPRFPSLEDADPVVLSRTQVPLRHRGDVLTVLGERLIGGPRGRGCMLMSSSRVAVLVASCGAV